MVYENNEDFEDDEEVLDRMDEDIANRESNRLVSKKHKNNGVVAAKDNQAEDFFNSFIPQIQ